MTRLTALTLTSSIFITTGLAMASPQADLSLDPNRMFFLYTAPGVNTGDFQVFPNNRYNPIVLPCDMASFSGQLDIDYLGTGPTVSPRFTEKFFINQTNQQIISNGCLNNTVLPEVDAQFSSMTAGSVQTDGYGMVSSTNVFCPWLFQPGDLPADTVVRIHLAVTGYTDGTYQTLLPDPDLSNNERDIYVRRSCSCQ